MHPVTQITKTGKLSLAHLNVQGINNKINKLEVMLKAEKPNFFIATGHWMEQKQSLVTTLSQYSNINCFCRTQATHGGVCIFSNKSISSKPLTIDADLTSEFTCECVGVTITFDSSKVALLAFYRSPSADVNIFLNNLHSILNSVSQKHEYLIVCGDLDINYLDEQVANKIICDKCSCFELTTALPTEPTRDFNNARSAIDYIMSNIPLKSGRNENIDISDHKIQFANFEVPQNTYTKKTEKKFTYKRHFTENNFAYLKLKLSLTDMSDLYKPNGPK
ncbi:hypothetical protein JTB14_038285 [Gonioctena quinquepunctata]|nr:hypothetical protein JTB14_038285 [Gonioctena quinquepunctata]